MAVLGWVLLGPPELRQGPFFWSGSCKPPTWLPADTPAAPVGSQVDTTFFNMAVLGRVLLGPPESRQGPFSGLGAVSSPTWVPADTKQTPQLPQRTVLHVSRFPDRRCVVFASWAFKLLSGLGDGASSDFNISRFTKEAPSKSLVPLGQIEADTTFPSADTTFHSSNCRRHPTKVH